MRTDDPPERTALYRLFDTDDRLLYVGIANNPERRWKQHAYEKADLWWHEVTDRTVEWFESREKAAAAEIIAIRAENPRYNEAHTEETYEQYISRFAGERPPLYRGQNGYVPLAELLRGFIDSGVWPAGQRVPPLEYIRRQFGVAAGTLQRALIVLQVSGLIVDTGGGRYYVVAEEERPILLPASDIGLAADTLRSRLSPEDRAELARQLLQP